MGPRWVEVNQSKVQFNWPNRVNLSNQVRLGQPVGPKWVLDESKVGSRCVTCPTGPKNLTQAIELFHSIMW